MEKLRLFENENWTVEDRCVREKLYKKITPSSSLFQSGDNLLLRTLEINFTLSDFQTRGASKYKDLKSNAFNLFNSIANAAAFATGKKKRLTIRAQVADAEQPAVAEKDYIEGRDSLRVYIEILMGVEYEVCGYRLIIADRSGDSKTTDLITQGLYESFRESVLHQDAIRNKVSQIQNQMRNRRRTDEQQSMETSPKYQYTNYHDPELYIKLVNEYFIGDQLLHQSLDPVPYTPQERVPFIDESHLLPHNRLKADAPAKLDFAATKFFTKEQAMFYRVERDEILPVQRRLSNYFNHDSTIPLRQDEDLDSDRLVRLVHDGIADRHLFRVPFPELTYEIDLAYFSQEVMSEMPLPHRLGSFLYTENDRLVVFSQLIAEKKQKYVTQTDLFSLDGREQFSVEPLANPRPLGIYQTEYDITPAIFQEYRELLNEDLKRHLTATQIPEQAKMTFLAYMRNMVDTRLRLLCDTVTRPKTDLLVQSVKKQPLHTLSQQPYVTTSSSAYHPNYHKAYLLSKRVAHENGTDSTSHKLEVEKMMSTFNTAYFRPILGQHRPAHASLATINMLKRCKHDPEIMEYDYGLILEAHNEEGYADIDARFFEKGKVREGHGEAYQAARRAYQEAALMEHWENFWHAPDKQTTRVAKCMKEFLRHEVVDQQGNKKVIYGDYVKVGKFDIQASLYHQFKLYLYSYYADQGLISIHFKPMDMAMTCKMAHCRSFPMESRQPKSHLLFGGVGMGGKSHIIAIVTWTSPEGVVEPVIHMTAQSLNLPGNHNNELYAMEEVTNSLVGGTSASTVSKGNSEAADNDVKNNWKQRMTQGYYVAKRCEKDENGTFVQTSHKIQAQCVLIAATNNEITNMDPNLATRMIIVCIPKIIDNASDRTPQNQTRLEFGTNRQANMIVTRELQLIHAIYFYYEQTVRAGVWGESEWGCEIDGGKIWLSAILGHLAAKYRVPTNDVRKFKHVLEAARTKCILSAIWIVLKSPQYRHLFHDPVTNEYIGFNPRVIIDGVVPLCVVQLPHVIDALTTFDCLWGHEFQDHVLSMIATINCRLPDLRDSDFLRRWHEDSIAAHPFVSNHRQVKNTNPSWQMVPENNQLVQNTPLWKIDYNYIVFTYKNCQEMHSDLASLSGDANIPASDISRILVSLERSYQLCDGYEMENGRLVRSKNPEHFVNRKMIYTGFYGLFQKPALAISVAFLRQKLPHILSENLIEDILTPSSSMVPVLSANFEKVSPGQNQARNTMQSLYEKMESSLLIKPGDPNDTNLINAIRDVVENASFGWTGEYTKEEEQLLYQDYADQMGNLPFQTFATSVYPVPLLTAQVAPDLYDEYRKIETFKREVSLVDIPTMIHLKRNPAGRPLVIYNHVTVSPMTRASLSVYQDEDPDDNVTDFAALTESLTTIVKHSCDLFANTPTFKVDRDLDYIYCQAYSRRIAMPNPRTAEGFLFNYSPHMYMSMVNFRDRREQETGRIRKLKQPHDNVMDRIKNTRSMILAALGRPDAATPSLQDLHLADFHPGDARALTVTYRITRRQRGAKEKEQKEVMDNFSETAESCHVSMVGTLKRPASVFVEREELAKKSRLEKAAKAVVHEDDLETEGMEM